MGRYIEDSEVSHVVDSHHGIYSAQIFCERFGDHLRADDMPRLRKDIAVCLQGPDHEEYIEAWVALSCYYDAVVVLDGKRFRIDENEGIYLVREDIEWCDECDWWASKECECPHVS